MDGFAKRLLSLIAAGMIALGDAQVAVAGVPNDFDLSSAVDFRTSYGLDADPEWVDSVATWHGVSTHFGTPLTPGEEALMVRRAMIPAELDRLREYRNANKDLWGGMWLTYPRPLPDGVSLVQNIAVTHGANDLREKLQALVPSDVLVNVVEVSHTEAELDAVIDDVAQSAPAFFANLGTEYYSAAVKPASNSAEIAIRDATPEIVDAARQRFGAGIVTAVAGGPVLPDACSRTTCGPPWMGGLKIYPSVNTNWCTSGFVARKWSATYQEWLYALWTAGHCDSYTWRRGSSSGTLIGTTQGLWYANNTAVDIQTIPIDDSVSSHIFIEGASSCSASCVFRFVAAKEGHNTDQVGQNVCNHGAKSGTQCGPITNTNFTLDYQGVTTIRMRTANYSRNAGDSGGPVTSWTTTAEGSHTHYNLTNGDAVFSQIWEIEQLSGWQVFLG